MKRIRRRKIRARNGVTAACYCLFRFLLRFHYLFSLLCCFSFLIRVETNVSLILFLTTFREDFICCSLYLNARKNNKQEKALWKPVILLSRSAQSLIYSKIVHA